MSCSLHGFWLEVCDNSYLYFLTGNVSFFSGCLQNFLFIFGLKQVNYDMSVCECVYVCVLILFVILWASWICGLLSFINFGKFLAISSSNISSVLFSPFYFWNSNCTYVRPFAIISQLLGCSLLLFSTVFGVSISTTWERNCLFLWSSPKTLLSSFQIDFLSTRKRIIKHYLFIWWQLNYSILCDAITGNYMDIDRNSDLSM